MSTAAYITDPFLFNYFIRWLWKKLLCPRGVHLFDEVLKIESDEISYYVCDGCDCRADIHIWEGTPDG